MQDMHMYQCAVKLPSYVCWSKPCITGWYDTLKDGLSREAADDQVGKKCPMLHGSRNFIAMFLRACPVGSTLRIFISRLFWFLWPPLWSSGESFWLQIQRSGFDSGRYQIFWEVVGLKRGPLSLESTTEELPGRKNSGSSLENRDYGPRGSAALTTWHPSIRKSWHWLRRQAVVARSV
jgi:hypothetical protein